MKSVLPILRREKRLVADPCVVPKGLGQAVEVDNCDDMYQLCD